MGAKVAGYEESTSYIEQKPEYYENKSEPIQELLFTSQKMSNNIVRIMDKMAGVRLLFDLLTNMDDYPFQKRQPEEQEKLDRIFEQGGIKKNAGIHQKIFPYPFNPEVKETHDVNVRVYYNEGGISANGLLSSGQMNIDIICSHEVWLCNAKTKEGNLRLIRPYIIQDLIITKIFRDIEKDSLGRPSGYKHFTVNSKYECLRIYVNTSDVEKTDGMLPSNLEDIFNQLDGETNGG